MGVTWHSRDIEIGGMARKLESYSASKNVRAISAPSKMNGPSGSWLVHVA